MGCFSWLCFWRRENLQEEEVTFPSVSSPSTSENGSAIDILPPEAFVSQQSYEPLASPRSPLIRSRGELTPPDTPVIPPAKRLKPDEKYVDFPFLRDDNTVEYIRRSKLMIILKGLPGSGKSTLAENIKKVYENAVVCSADHFFMVDGQYNFNPQKLKDAHGNCQKKAVQAAKRNCSVIIIDNTNIKNWESSVYLQMCKKYHYVAIIVEPQTPWCFDVQELVRKNSHEIKEEIIVRKLNDYQAALPIYYAWFLNEPDSLRVSKIAWQWLEKALLEIDDFFRDFKQITKLSSVDDILQYFVNENITLHTTAKFTGRGKPHGSLEYINDPEVKCALGQCYPLNIIGFVITPRTFGARIKLTDEELELWGSNDYETPPDNLMRVPEFVNKKEPYTTTSAHDNDDGDEGNDNDNLVDSCEPKIIITPQEMVKNRFWPTSGIGSRAHITLGCAWGVKPVTTGFDLIDVISCEQIEEDSKKHNENAMDVDLEDSGSKTYNFYGAVMKCYGKGRWVIYPEDKIIVESLFSAFY
ncbi:2',3'-cyclic-nucleotide 3'-phosphodiesterase-like isoform X2 [Macrobrachium rosenbergii]|uniref:2',3'-cyclic-nucleotide 3'-phosphodiesterase-like isoform X2 n=1 Tax=Macrobrachium rosenbergii TaxID=79674 RepID=UPI0034D63555